LSARATLAALLLLPSANVLADEVMNPAGLAPVRIGMTLVQAERALGRKLDFDRKDSDSASCFQAERPGDKNTMYMLQRYRVTRIDTWNDTITTPEHARVGDTEAALRKLYGNRATFSVHPYLGKDGHYVTAKFPGRKLIFETEKGRVTSWRVGYPAAAEYIEGCA
jgi:hypothetical protein